MNRTVQLVTLSAILTVSACSTLPHSTARVQARRHWDQVRARVKFQLAEKEYENKLFEQAIRTASEAVVLDPTQADTYVLLAQANLELGKPATAQQALGAAKRAGLTNPDLIYTQGVILEQRGHIEAALAKYAEARELDDAKVDYLVAQAECLVELNRPEIAMKLLNAHKERFDDDGTIAVLAARIAELMGDAEGAVRRYRDALLTLGDSPMVARELGLLLAELGRYDEAVAVLEPLVAEASDVEVGGAVRRALATCYLARWNPTAAKRVLDEYGRTHPDDIRAQLLLAEAAIGTDDMLTALRAVEAARQREPHRPEVRLMRAVVQWKRRDFGGAAGSLFDLLSDNPEDVEAHCLLAEVLSARNQLEAARTHFERALRIDANCAWAAAGLNSLPKDTPPTPQLPTTKLTSATGP